MNDRGFAAAHDRYLDPPDFDDTEEDEDSAYDKARERRQAEEDQAADAAFWRNYDEND